MKKNRFYAEGGKSLYRRVLAIALVLALMIAAIPVASAFAQDDAPNNLEDQWGNKLRQLAIEISFFNNFQTKPGQFGNDAKQGQYLDRYRAALAAAQSLVVSQGGFDGNGQMISQGQANRAVRDLGNLLSTIRGLREKIRNGDGTNTANIQNNVTANNNNPSVISNNNNNQNANANNASNSMNISGQQIRSLQAARAFFNNFQTQPGRFRNAADREQMQRYLDLYASTLSAAETVVVNGGLTTTDGQQVLGTGNQSPERLLAMYLHTLRSLRAKIAGAGR